MTRVAGMIYMHKERGNIGILRYGQGIIAWTWELEFKSSVFPEELNPDFWAVLRRDYVQIGYL